MPVVCIETQRARIRIARRIVSLQSTLYVFFGSRTVDGAEMIEKMTLAIGQTALLEKSRVTRARALGRHSSTLHSRNVCPPRFLLRRPRRRLQGDQGPSTYFIEYFFASLDRSFAFASDARWRHVAKPVPIDRGGVEIRFHELVECATGLDRSRR